MKNKLITRFHLRNGIIYLRITVNGERAEISTNCKNSNMVWNKSLQRVNSKDEKACLINSSLNSLLYKVERIFNNLDMKDERISVHQIINEIKGRADSQMTLFYAYEYHIENISTLVGIDYTPTTVKRYKSSFNSMKRYRNYNDIKLCDLDYNFILGYHSYLKSKESLKHNSAAKNIKNLNAVIRTAVRNNWISSNPFKDFSCNYINPPRCYLTDDEINSLIDKQFKIDRLTKARDVFIFQIYTGLSYIDLYSLNESNFKTGVDGKEWIILYRKKTHVRSAIPILPRAKEILLKYNYHLPVYCNQRTNSYLKEIADLCNIQKPLTSHIARHTFATTITLSKGVPIETVSKMLGHTDIKTTQIYAKITDVKVSNDMKTLM
jgi:site-specific recombinase XerD